MTLLVELLPPEWIEPPSGQRWMAAIALLLMGSVVNCKKHPFSIDNTYRYVYNNCQEANS